jgi:hypothetical protein
MNWREAEVIEVEFGRGGGLIAQSKSTKADTNTSNWTKKHCYLSPKPCSINFFR